MSLLPWDDDPNKKNDIFNPNPIRQVASVQSGSWQPAQSGADSAVATNDITTPQHQTGNVFDQPQQSSTPAPAQDNYLVSDQHAQVEQQKAQHDAEIAQARREQAARQAAAADAARAQQFEQGKATDQNGQRIDVNAMKNDNGWKKYYNDAFKREKDSLNQGGVWDSFWAKAMDNGQASKRAEVAARNKYASELINRAYDENGNVLDPNAARLAHGVTAYNSALAQDNSTRGLALARAIGATKDNQGGGFWNRLKDTVEAEKQMNLFNGFAGANDGQTTDWRDVGGFAGGLVQGFGTMIPIGLKDLKESATGQGTDAQTGFEGNLTAAERVGRGISGALDVATPFVGGSGKLLDSFTTKAMTKGLSGAETVVAGQLASRIATGTASEVERRAFVQLTAKAAESAATQAEKSALTKLASQVALPAIEQGGIGAAQAGSEYFGNGNTITDEHGNLDMNKVKQLATQSGEAGLLGLGGGALMSGAGMGIKAYRNRGSNMPALSPEQLAELETANSNAGAAELVNMRPTNEPGSQVQAMQNGEVAPAPAETQQQAADGTVQPADPLTAKPADGTATGDPVLTPVDNLTPDMLPTGEYSPTGADLTPNAEPVPQNTMVNPDPTAPAPLDSTIADGAPAPSEAPATPNLADITPLAGKNLPKVDAAPAPVADGAALPTVAPVRDNAPLPVAEKVRALQDARAGTNQAQEAAINQELQQTQNTIPQVDTPTNRYKTETTKESDIAKNIHIQELDHALQTIQQRRAQLIADGHPETFHAVKQLDKAANDIIKQQNDIANGVRNTDAVTAENTRLFGDKSNVGFTDGITTETGKRAVGVTQDGAGASNIIIDRNAHNAEAVLHHEAVHKTLNDFTTPEERASIIDSYRNHHGIDPKMSNDHVEELLADDFNKFVANKRAKDAAGNPRADMNLPAKVKDYFEQTWQRIQDAYASMKANGTLTPQFEKLYNDLNNGKFVNKSVIAKAADPRIENRYMVAGKGAKTFDSTDAAGRNFTGIDKKTRFEINDAAAKLSQGFIDKVKAAQKSHRAGDTVRLGDVIDHSPLFKAYPSLADLKVSLFHEAPANGRIKYGGYTPSLDSMRLNVHPRTASELRATILHEVQHAIQEREGFVGGLTKPQQRALGRGQPAGEKYFRSADELESRLVESRRNMSQSERDATSFYDSLPADKPIGKTVIGNKDYSTLTPVHTSTRISQEMAAAGKKPTPNKNIVPEPFENNLPNDLQPNAPTRAFQPIPRKPRPTISPEQKKINDFADRVFTNTDLHKDFKKRLARALGMSHDSELPIHEILAGSKLSDGEKAAITKKFGELEQTANDYNALMAAQRKGYKSGKTTGLSEDISRQANGLIDKYGRIERDLNSRVRRIQGQKSLMNRAANVAENLTGARNANILTSVGGVERNLTQELGVNILETIMHPIRMTRNTVHAPAEIIRAYKRAGREFTNAPKTVSEAFPYLLGNTYRLIMSPVTGVANVRKSVAREVLAESLLRAQGESPSRADIKRFAGAMGADSEVVANSLMGIMNGMTSHGKGLEVMRAYQDFIKTGSPAAKERFLANTEHAANLAAKMTQVAAESDKPGIRLGIALMNTVFPFVNTATNLARTSVTYNLNPIARSVNDEVLRSVRSNPANVMSILKSKGVNYGVMAGVYGLYQAGVVGYNDGEDVSKPNGVYIDLGNGKFFPVRGTPIELPIAAVVTAAEIAKHTADGNPKPPSYYAAIMGKSLPYVDSANNLIASTASAADAYMKGDATGGTGDNGYAAKAYGLNLAKSYVPYSNNGVIPAVNAVQGKSTNAKSVYDKNPATWFKNSVQSAYDPAFRSSLKDSRDMSGRVRTVDQQGGFTINKTINDTNTATYNKPVIDLVRYGQKTGLGNGTQDMFNTYDTGKNNNFKSVQDTITFLDEPSYGGKAKPDAANKLKQNGKLTDLSQQMRNGFFGDTGSELLTLDGKNLMSDASVPTKDGSKNSKLPLSMQSIKNAVAQTDLSKDQSDQLYAISGQSTDLYSQLKAKSITYDQYTAAKAQLGAQETSILSGSKNYAKLNDLFNHLDETGFFNPDGLGATKSGQTYLWNSLNTLLGSKGATPAAQYPTATKGFTPWGSGGGTGRSATDKPGDRGNRGIQWTPAGKRQMAGVTAAKFTPVNINVKLGNEIKKDRTQNYADRSF